MLRTEAGAPRAGEKVAAVAGNCSVTENARSTWGGMSNRFQTTVSASRSGGGALKNSPAVSVSTTATARMVLGSRAMSTLARIWAVSVMVAVSGMSGASVGGWWLMTVKVMTAVPPAL